MNDLGTDTAAGYMQNADRFGDAEKCEESDEASLDINVPRSVSVAADGKKCKCLGDGGITCD
jgi:hypothetical protein